MRLAYGQRGLKILTDWIYPVVCGLVRKKSNLAFVVLFVCFFMKVKFVAKGFLSLQMSFSCSSIILFFMKSLFCTLFWCRYPLVSRVWERETFQSPAKRTCSELGSCSASNKVWKN